MQNPADALLDSLMGLPIPARSHGIVLLPVLCILFRSRSPPRTRSMSSVLTQYPIRAACGRSYAAAGRSTLRVATTTQTAASTAPKASGADGLTY